MKIVAIVPCRNESWIAGLSFRALLMWVDELVVLDHASVPPVADFWNAGDADRVTVLRVDDPTWQEMPQRQSLLEEARKHDATHIVCIDSDEVLCGNLLPGIRAIVERTPSHSMLHLPWIQLRGSIHTMHADGIWAKSYATTAFLDDPTFHWEPDAQGYQHHHRHPSGYPFIPYRPLSHAAGGIMHLQMVNEERLRAKQYRYELCDRLRWPSRKSADEVRRYYSWAVYGYQPDRPLGAFRPDHRLAPVPDEWWQPYSHLLKYLRPEMSTDDWYLAECCRMLATDPSLASGLDSFGVEVGGLA